MPRGGHSSASSALNSFKSTPSLSPTTFTDSLPLPSLLVFDLDYTLWPFWIDTHASPPLKPLPQTSKSYRRAMQDRYGETFTFYPEVPGILAEARRKNMLMGIASRTTTPDLAAALLKGVDIPLTPTKGETDADSEKTEPIKAFDFFAFREMYPGSKTRHFQKIQASTKTLGKTDSKIGKGGIAFEDMLFFDDESRNREVERELGVTFCLVRDGVTRDEVDRGVWEWRKRRGITKKKTGDGSSSASQSTTEGDFGGNDSEE